MPKFDVADVHVSPGTSLPAVRGPFFSSSRYELRFATMLDLVRIAYGVEPERVYGGPSWLEMDRFDIFAKTPAGSTAASRRLMLQALLAERFQLAVHTDERSVPAYALTAPKRPQFKEADESGESGCKFAVQNANAGGPPPGGGPITIPVISYTCKNTTMAAFSKGMLDMAGSAQYFNGTPVVDRTGLDGAWDFTFRFTPKIPAGIPVTGENLPLFDALEKQLGLKLEMSTAPMPGLVVDHVERKPTENSAEAMKSFPPLPTEFEVVDLKPSDPAANPANSRPDVKNGRVYIPRMTLKNLIQIAWDLGSDEMLAGAPKWLNEDRFDILAKTPEGVALGEITPQRSGIPVNIDALRPMLRAMVVDRFKLASHMEERPVTMYTLTAPKPKLKKADPNSRTRWQEGAVADAKGKNANAALGRMVTCQNVSMAQFANMLPGIAPGYIQTSVVDSTGLEGGWDFTFSFSPVGVVDLSRQRPENDSEASDPNGAVSLFDAVTKQLGLKIEPQKRPAQVLVIDHVERKPTEN